VDVEPIASGVDVVIPLVCTTDEAAWVHASEERFTLLWTQKESISKAIGKGLNLAPDRFSILPLDEHVHHIDGFVVSVNSWKFDGHIIPCATIGTDFPDELVKLDIKQLVDCFLALN